jgi:hypothetical protein
VRPVARRGASGRPRQSPLVPAGATRGGGPIPPGELHGQHLQRASGRAPDGWPSTTSSTWPEIPHPSRPRQAIDTTTDGRVAGPEVTRWRDRECPRLAAACGPPWTGRPVPLAVTVRPFASPRGVGGLEDLRLESALAAPTLPAGRPSGLRRHQPGGKGRLARDHRRRRPHHPRGRRRAPHQRQRPPHHLPSDQLRSPLDQRSATLRFHAGGPPTPGSDDSRAPASGGPAGDTPTSGVGWTGPRRRSPR